MARTTHKVAETRTFGIEIEAYNVRMDTLCDALNAAGIACVVEGYNHATRAHWKIVSDGSLTGRLSFELVSPPLKGQAGLAQVKTVCDVLAACRAKVNVSCGLHVHHDANDLTIKDWKNLLKYFVKFEASMDSVQPISRRENNNQFCQSLRPFAYDNTTGTYAQRSIAETFALIDACDTLEALSRTWSSRYYKLNLQAFWRHGTVEVRHHAGTTEYEKIAAWVELTQCLITRACEQQTVSVRGTDLDAMLATKQVVKANMHSKCSTHTVRFYHARQAELAA